MSKISEMTRESWIESTFPEWGTWLVEDIENEVVAPGNVAMWWLGCTGVWFKTPADTNITIDLWCGNGKRTHGDGKMKVGHQMANMCGGRAMQPNLRNVPFVIDPFAFKKVDAVLATHYHQDHMSAEWAAHVINSGMTTTDENGNPAFTWGTIMLPEGKKPIVMSQDDVCYYPYMDGDGFASKIVVGEDGRPTCEMKMDDGSISTGSYDLIPLLNDFIDEHPDFSYKGAKAIIALTGYEGILGYRTASSYSETPDYESEKEQAARVAQCLRDDGWALASHSWGHLWMGVSDDPENPYKISDERFYTDTDKWKNEVESLIGPTDIYIYPNGNDVADWHPYTEENYRYQYLASKGFRYFCNVDASKPAWIQKGPDYLRMARRNLDGYRLYEDMIQEDPAKKRLSDLFDASQIFDPSRPTPVTWNYGHTQNETPAPEPEQ